MLLDTRVGALCACMRVEMREKILGLVWLEKRGVIVVSSIAETTGKSERINRKIYHHISVILALCLIASTCSLTLTDLMLSNQRTSFHMNILGNVVIFRTKMIT